jgi:reactive intermediate/imine deaminase
MIQAVHTDQAPQTIGSYSQAVTDGSAVYLSGQIPLDPMTMQLVAGDMTAQVKQVFENLKAVAEAAGGHMDAIVRLTVYLLDLSHTNIINEVMKTYFPKLFPARTTIGVVALPKGATVEVDAIMTVKG